MTRTILALALFATVLAHAMPAAAYERGNNGTPGATNVSGTDLGSGRIDSVSGLGLGGSR